MNRLLARYTNSYLSYVLLYLFYNIGFAAFSALISVYLIDKGYAASQVSLVVSVAALAAMLTQPVIGSLTDRFGMRRVNLIMFVTACVAAFVFIFARAFALVLSMYALMYLLINGANPVVERMATSSPYGYGKVRMWGTLGFAAGTQVAGLVYDYFSPESLYVLFIGAMVVCIIGFLGTQPRIPEAEVANVASDGEPVSVRDLVTNKKFLYYLVIEMLLCGVTGGAYSFIPSYLTNLGLPAATASTILSVAVVCELPLILLSAKFMDKVPNKTLLMCCFGMLVVQTLIYGLALPLPLIIVATFIGKHPPAMLNIMTNMKVVNTIVDPRQQITGLALAKAAQNLGTIIANNICGRMIDAFGYPPMFCFLLGMAAAGMLLSLLFQVPSGNDKKLFS